MDCTWCTEALACRKRFPVVLVLYNCVQSTLWQQFVSGLRWPIQYCFCPSVFYFKWVVNCVCSVFRESLPCWKNIFSHHSVIFPTVLHDESKSVYVSSAFIIQLICTTFPTSLSEIHPRRWQLSQKPVRLTGSSSEILLFVGGGVLNWTRHSIRLSITSWFMVMNVLKSFVGISSFAENKKAFQV